MEWAVSQKDKRALISPAWNIDHFMIDQRAAAENRKNNPVPKPEAAKSVVEPTAEPTVEIPPSPESKKPEVMPEETETPIASEQGATPAENRSRLRQLVEKLTGGAKETETETKNTDGAKYSAILKMQKKQ